MTVAQYGMTAEERSAWLKERRNGLGGSDIAAVLGLSPWTSPYALWGDKVGLLPDLDQPTEAMDFGLRAERMLAEWFTDRTGLYVAGEQMSVTGAEPWMRCSLDGLVFEHPLGEVTIDDAIAAAEWKTTGDSAAEWEQKVPDYYATQATWTSIVTGLDVVWFGVLHLAFGRPQFRTYEFVPDADDKALVVDRARRFWFDHVVAGIPPETDGSESTSAALAAMYPEHVEGETVDVTDLADYIALRSELKEQQKVRQKRVDEIDNQLAAAFGTAEVGLIDGQPALTYRAQTRTTTCVACQHSTTSDPFRVLRPVKPKKGK